MKSTAEYSRQTAELTYMTAANSATTHKLVSILVIGFGLFGVCLFGCMFGGKKQPVPSAYPAVAPAPHPMPPTAPVRRPAPQPYNPAYQQPGANLPVPPVSNQPLPDSAQDEEKTV